MPDMYSAMSQARISLLGADLKWISKQFKIVFLLFCVFVRAVFPSGEAALLVKKSTCLILKEVYIDRICF